MDQNFAISGSDAKNAKEYLKVYPWFNIDLKNDSPFSTFSQILQ